MAALSAVNPPTVTGSAVVGSTPAAVPPLWNQTGVTTTQGWLRDGGPVIGATAGTYRLTTADIGHRISVTATGTTADDRASCTSAATATVTKVRSALALTGTSPAVD